MKKIMLVAAVVPLLLAGCGAADGPAPTVTVTAPAAPAPTVTETVEPEPSADPAELWYVIAEKTWLEQSAESREQMCLLYNLDPATAKEAFMSDLGEDGPEMWSGLRRVLDERC